MGAYAKVTSIRLLLGWKYLRKFRSSVRIPSRSVQQAVGKGRLPVPSAYFFQDCPTCGRHVRIKAEYLGKRMSCLHCEGEFTATDRDSRFHVPENRSGGLLQAVETL